MKIAIAGAHRVGKTTLAEALAAALPSYTLYMEPYYALEESGYAFSDEPNTDDFIKQFQYSAKQISKAGTDAIFDRCPIDILAYIHAIDDTQNIQSLFNTAQQIIAGIDLLVFVPIETPDIIACVQSDFPALRTKVNDILYEWLDDFDVKTIEISGALQDRKEQVLKQL
ncbi:AAA family ATPase [Filimonas effusa]|uniref:NadR/Ttd14 AAA domain-containing protein n=1 Tax=Filimonas effusa TaxID=2508721 RepID=A0A4Q1DB12_9BACT|nr:AAA family ATPase [Filimonas effusa]RXK85753.1 hypothetical protein ESB13_02765 [Filimonas effusa]